MFPARPYLSAYAALQGGSVEQVSIKPIMGKPTMKNRAKNSLSGIVRTFVLVGAASAFAMAAAPSSGGLLTVSKAYAEEKKHSGSGRGTGHEGTGESGGRHEGATGVKGKIFRGGKEGASHHEGGGHDEGGCEEGGCDDGHPASAKAKKGQSQSGSSRSGTFGGGVEEKIFRGHGGERGASHETDGEHDSGDKSEPESQSGE